MESSDEDRSYTDPRYWDSRYATALRSCGAPTGEDAVFDWLCEPAGISEVIRGLAGTSGAPLLLVDLGCGNSQLAETIVAKPSVEEENPRESRRPGPADNDVMRGGDTLPAKDSWTGCYLIGQDYSSGGVLEAMHRRMQALGLSSRTDFLVSDARWPGLRDGVIDVVVDKGCLDSVLQDYDQVRLAMKWKRSTSRQAESLPELVNGSTNAKALLEKAYRMLAPGGAYLMVSYEPPAGRQEFLQALDWNIETMGRVDDMGNYWYVCRKKAPGRAGDGEQNAAHPEDGGLNELD